MNDNEFVKDDEKKSEDETVKDDSTQSDVKEDVKEFVNKTTDFAIDGAETVIKEVSKFGKLALKKI